MNSTSASTPTRWLFGCTLLCALTLTGILATASTACAGAWFQEYGIDNKRELVTPAAVPGLIRALADRDANVRKAAAGALGKIGPAAQEAVPALKLTLKSDRHPKVRAEAAEALLRIGKAALAATPEMVAALGDEDPNVRKMLVVALHRLGYRGEDYRLALSRMAASEPHAKVRALAEKTLAAFGEAGDTPTTAAAPPSATPTEEIDLPAAKKENRYGVAVIIGNRNYTSSNKDVPNVDYAHNDADAIYRYVTGTLGFREGNVILLKDATQADLVSTFGTVDNPKGKLYDWVKPNQSDVFVYYSGHGAPGLSNGQGYLLPVDGNPMKVELNGYPLETFYFNIARIPAKTTTIVVDACFSGSSASGTVVRNASSISLKLVDTEVKAPKATILTAAGVSEVASWDQNSQHGLFTSYLLRGLAGSADGDDFGNGDGRVSLGELKKYLQEEVTYNARRLYGRDQNPQISGDPQRVLLGE